MKHVPELRISCCAVIAVVTAMVVLCCGFGFAQPASASDAVHVWKASWITSPDAPSRQECILRFRKTLKLQSAPQKYVIHVSADNQFMLVVNGKLVGYGPSRSDVPHWKYETYDIAPMLHAGANQIAATVWNFGDAAPVRQIWYRLGFVIDGDTAAEEAIKTDATWDVAVEKGIATLPNPEAFKWTYYVASPAELLDGNAILWDWDKPELAKQAGWKKASEIGQAFARGTAFAATEWQLVPDKLPPMEMTQQEVGRAVRVFCLSHVTVNRAAGDSGDKEPGAITPCGEETSSAKTFPKAAIEIPPHKQVSLLIDNGILTTAFPELTVSKGEKSKIVMTYSEALVDAKNKKGNRNEIEGRHITGIYDEIRPDGESRVYRPLDWRTWRYLQIDVTTEDQPLVLENLRAWFTAYPFHEAGAFASDDASLKPIWDVGWRTARLCAHDTYNDTPYWERLQYVGDTRLQSLISYSVAGDDRLARQAIEAFHNSTIPEGIPLSRYPSNAFQSIPGFSLLWIGMVHDNWMYRNDPEYVKSQLSVVRSTLEFFRSKQNKNGLMGKLPWWPFVDWVEDFKDGDPPETPTGDSAILSLQMVEALRYASELESALGNKALAAQDAEEAARIANAVRELCWDDKTGLIADTPEKKHFSQHANAWAVWLDVIPAAEQQTVMQKILSVSDPTFKTTATVPKLSLASFYFRFYLTRALVHCGLGDRYLDTLGPWRKMLAEGLTTWAETPDQPRSDSHAWSSHPNYDFLTIVAGIAPSSPGFTKVKIEPHLGALRHVDATYPAPSGKIHAVFDRDDTKLAAKITLPAGMSGTFVWNGKTFKLSPGTQELSLSRTK